MAGFSATCPDNHPWWSVFPVTSGLLPLLVLNLLFLQTLVLLIAFFLVKRFAFKPACLHCISANPWWSNRKALVCDHHAGAGPSDGQALITEVKNDLFGKVAEDDIRFLGENVSSNGSKTARVCPNCKEGRFTFRAMRTSSEGSCVRNVELFNVGGVTSFLRRRKRQDGDSEAQSLVRLNSRSENHDEVSVSTSNAGQQGAKIEETALLGSFEDHDEEVEPKDGALNVNEGIQGSNVVLSLRKALKAEREALCKVYTELEEERNAAETAANEAMAMILRLQEEKAAFKLEAAHYQRIAEEKSVHDEQAIQLLQEDLANLERENQVLEKELNMLRSRQAIDKEIESPPSGMLLLTEKEGYFTPTVENGEIEGLNFPDDEASTPHSRVLLLTNEECISSRDDEGRIGASISHGLEISIPSPGDKELSLSSVRKDERDEGSDAGMDSFSEEPAYKRLKDSIMQENGVVNSTLMQEALDTSLRFLTERVPSDEISSADKDNDEAKTVLDQLCTIEEQLQMLGNLENIHSCLLAQVSPNNLTLDCTQCPSATENCVASDGILAESCDTDIDVLKSGEEYTCDMHEVAEKNQSSTENCSPCENGRVCACLVSVKSESNFDGKRYQDATPQIEEASEDEIWSLGTKAILERHRSAPLHGNDMGIILLKEILQQLQEIVKENTKTAKLKHTSQILEWFLMHNAKTDDKLTRKRSHSDGPGRT